MRLHTAGLSIRETVAVPELPGVDRSRGAVWQWVHRLADSIPEPPSAEPARVAVDEIAVHVGTEWYWLYAAVALDSLYLLDVAVFRRHGTDPAGAFLHGLAEQYDVAETAFLTDAYGYRAALPG